MIIICLNPKWIYKNGKYKKDNYRGAEGDYYELGTFSKCGSCSQCQNEKSNNWLVRNYYEQMSHKRSCFVTLTYENSPIIIVQKDLQDFIKRLRTNLDRTTSEKVRFFAASEYGEINNRPHFHIIIYGWDDENAKLKGINKKNNIYYESEMIKETWGLGRTSYQRFDQNEITYLSLYNTAKDEFKKGYKLNQNSYKKLEAYAKNTARMEPNQRRNLIETLSEKRKELENSKYAYNSVREKNTWSKALGWEKFSEEYFNSKNYAFEHYIANGSSVGIFSTPSSWVKKLANEYGEISAAEEMYRRENLEIKETNEDIERQNNLIREWAKKKQDVLNYHDKKTGIAEL